MDRRCLQIVFKINSQHRNVMKSFIKKHSCAHTPSLLLGIPDISRHVSQRLLVAGRGKVTALTGARPFPWCLLSAVTLVWVILGSRGEKLAALCRTPCLHGRDSHCSHCSTALQCPHCSSSTSAWRPRQGKVESSGQDLGKLCREPGGRRPRF